jgi:hypothetical protein
MFGRLTLSDPTIEKERLTPNAFGNKVISQCRWTNAGELAKFNRG